MNSRHIRRQKTTIVSPKFQTESGEPGAGRLLGYASKLVRDGKKYLMFITLTNIMKEQHIDIAAKREEWRHAMMHIQN